MKQAINDHLAFYRQFRENFQTTGALAPSGRFLARALTNPLAGRAGPVRILEVGPGTGAVTRRIVSHLKPGDRLDLVELNPRFAELLELRFSTDSLFVAAAPQTAIHTVAVQDYQADARYDFIVSGLPLNNFPPTLVEDIFTSFVRLLEPGGTLSYFEYMYVRPMRRLLARDEERKRLAALEAVLNRYLGPHRIRQDWVFANMPPAWVQHLRIG